MTKQLRKVWETPTTTDLIITKDTRRRRLWLVGGTLALIIVLLIAAAIYLLQSEKNSTVLGYQRSTVPTLTLEDVLSGRLNPRAFNASWISGNELMYRDSDGSIVLLNVQNKNKNVILPRNNSILGTAFNYELSADRKYLLIAHDYQKLYRYSYLAKYSIVDLNTSAVSRVVTNQGEILNYAQWSPVGNGLVFVSHFNIYYRPEAAKEAYKVLTVDGLQGHIHNGIPDWVYEEEVFNSNTAVWFSPDGTKLAYAKFNDTRVPLMTIPVYGIAGSLDFQYPRGVQIRYPKPGTTNPVVTLHLVDLDKEVQQELEAPDSLRPEPILAAVTWAHENAACAIWMNRIQNMADIVTYNYKSGEKADVQKVKSIEEPRGWLDLLIPPLFNKEGNKFFLIKSQKQNDNSFRHVTEISTENGEERAITSGKFVVTEILAFDQQNNKIFYQANTEDDPAVQHVYSIDAVPNSSPKCLTCSVKTSSEQKKCLYNSAKFSADNSHFVLQCLGPGVPEIDVFSTAGTKLLFWEDNEDLVEFVSDKALPKIKRMTFKVSGGFEAQVLLKLPPSLDESGKTKYPLLINVYGGPDSFQVLERFSLDWGSYLSANKSIIYGVIDGRGSGLKGDNILFSIYNKLGTVEIMDQINVTKQIQKALPYVDANHTAIWGWSYGGYASGMALANDKSNVFKCGMSVAPVTDWILYDSIYTERFMGLPTKNHEAYVRAQLLDKYDGLRGKEYYLIHGTLDDNVHYQQSMLWSKELEKNDILFRQQSYPDEDHGLISVRHHLYHSLEDFLDDCFQTNQ